MATSTNLMYRYHNHSQTHSAISPTKSYHDLELYLHFLWHRQTARKLGTASQQARWQLIKSLEEDVCYTPPAPASLGAACFLPDPSVPSTLRAVSSGLAWRQKSPTAPQYLITLRARQRHQNPPRRDDLMHGFRHFPPQSMEMHTPCPTHSLKVQLPLQAGRRQKGQRSWPLRFASAFHKTRGGD